VGEHEKALADRDQAVRLKPDSAEAHLARGGSFHALGQHEKGLADRSEAIRLKPEMPEAWCARGSAYFLLAGIARRRDDLNHALRLKPDYQEARECWPKQKSDRQPGCGETAPVVTTAWWPQSFAPKSCSGG